MGNDITALITLLGEKDLERLRTGLVDLLLEQVKKDLEFRYECDYIFDYEDVYDQAMKVVREDCKQRFIDHYNRIIDKKMAEMFPEGE